MPRRPLGIIVVGAALVLRASSWGVVGLGAFFAVHWSCDFGWSLFVSAASHKAGHLWSGRVHRFVFAACGIFLVGFGAWFIRAAVAG